MIELISACFAPSANNSAAFAFSDLLQSVFASLADITAVNPELLISIVSSL
jgi:hypothetical protein